MLFKVCGMRDPQNIRAIERLGIDMMGFIFHPASPRYVGRRPDYLPDAATRTGVFVDADADDRLIRVIYRDCIERGRTPQMVIDRYERVLKPMHNQYIEPAKRYADLIVPQGGNNEVAINLLTDYIKSRLRKSNP